MITTQVAAQFSLAVAVAVGGALADSTSAAVATGPEAGHILHVILPAPLVTCKCNASVAFSPTDGVIRCPGSGTQPIAVQIIWETPTPTKGDCKYVPPDGEGQGSCDQIANSKCSADVEPLDVTLYNCWSGGKWVKATGLQSGNWFWFTNDSGVEFDPNLEADCLKQGGTKYGTYTIEFASSSGGTVEATFTITLSCANCTTQ